MGLLTDMNSLDKPPEDALGMLWFVSCWHMTYVTMEPKSIGNITLGRKLWPDILVMGEMDVEILFYRILEYD